MGISASQARLLTITARLTSNEYESQQISNAKMRLAIQSEQASNDYIAALNSRQLQFVTYDAQGTAITESLTANAIYQYSDMKNQYALINSTGQMMVSTTDAKNFKAAENLTDFLALNGIEKIYKTESLKENAIKLENRSTEVDGGVLDYYDAWEDAINVARNADYKDADGNTISSDEKFQLDKFSSQAAYQEALKNYQDKVALSEMGVNVDLDYALAQLSVAKNNYTNCITFDKWVQSQVAFETAMGEDGEEIKVETEVYKNAQKYYEVLEEFLAEAEDLGCTNVNETYEYSDATKAQWYTNLWYKMNGPSTEKSTQGDNAANYTVLDPQLASSKEWIQKALAQGLITLEVASYAEDKVITDAEVIAFKDLQEMIAKGENPLVLTLKGVSWNATEYGSCADFTEIDDESAVARAEAEYQKKNNEISAKDKRYENKIKTLDTEHNTLQTEYESVKSAMTKNIDRSFKTFS